MYQDLEVIARLKFGKVMEATATQMREDIREKQAQYTTLTGGAGIRSGQHEASIARIKIDASAKMARSLLQIWIDLIEQRNGHIARGDVDFIVNNVEQFTHTQTQHLLNSSAQSGGGFLPSMVEEMRARMYAVTAGARRDLEIMVREHEAFPAKQMAQKEESMKHVPKKRFSPGRRVLVGMGMRPAIVISSDDQPSVLGEFRHDVRVDGDDEVMSVLGCDLQPLPELDEDLRTSRPTIHIQNSNVANLNLGSQVGMINANLQAMSEGSDTQVEFARAIEQLTQAVLTESALGESEKGEVVQAIASLSQQAAKKPEERSKGTVKALVSWLPTAISAANNLVTLWDKLGPSIKAYLGI